MLSTTGEPFVAALTILAWSGVARPSAATNSPASLSSWLNAFMNAICALRASFGHVIKVSQLAFVAFMIKICFISFVPFIGESNGDGDFRQRVKKNRHDGKGDVVPE